MSARRELTVVMHVLTTWFFHLSLEVPQMPLRTSLWSSCHLFLLVVQTHHSINLSLNLTLVLTTVQGWGKHDILYIFLGEKDGAVVRALVSHQCGPGSIPSLCVTCGLSLLLVLVLAPRGFSLGTPVFPSSKKKTPI